jgi:hypothetical protein
VGIGTLRRPARLLGSTAPSLASQERSTWMTPPARSTSSRQGEERVGVAASVPDRAALHALEPHLGGLAERPLAERDLGVRPPRLRFREAGEGLEQPLALAGAPDVRLVRRPASARAPDREGQSLPWRARIPAVTPATATSSSDGGATVAPQSEPDFSPRQWPEADVTRVRKKERNPLVMRVPGSPRETGPAGLEPATPGLEV